MSEIDPVGVHASHCCPEHGCKYVLSRQMDPGGYLSGGVPAELPGGYCPVVAGEAEPIYEGNNGCEMCEDENEEAIHAVVTMRMIQFDPLPLYLWKAKDV